MYLCSKQPSSVDAPGLYECLKKALTYLGVDQTCKLIDLECDGASENLGARALKGLVKEERPWIVVVWCFAHRLELAIKDALKNTFFSTINERMLRLYYIYRKAAKKCREFKDLIAELSECLDTSEFPTSGGSRPISTCGTTHNVAALNRIIDRFGAYLSHITALTEDSSTTPDDKQKLKGDVTKWRESKMLTGCAVFHDILKPTSLLCKHLQSDQLCTISDIEAILKFTKAIEN